MIQNLSQIELECLLIASVLSAGLDGYKKLPLNFRATVFSVGSYQDVWRTVELCVKENVPIDLVSLPKHVDQKLAGELVEIIATVAVGSCLVDGQLEEAASELIRRAENRADVMPLNVGKTETNSEARIDTSSFSAISLEELIDVLGMTIKKDNENKLMTFLCQLSAYTDNSQLNLSFNAPSSSGKSYIPTEISKLFPREDVIEIGYCSPTAFFHDCGQFNKEKGGYIVDLERKILVFLDQPHTLLLQHLRPLLSHDQKEISLKITDKSQKAGLRTKNIFLRGFPAVIFCTAGLKIDEQESTRFLLLSPEIDQEKIREAVNEKIIKETDNAAYALWLDSDPRRKLLKERIRAIKQAGVEEIKISNPEKVKELFFDRSKILKPKHQRDVGRIIGLIKALALLNLWFRQKEESTIVANESDIDQAFSLWDDIASAQELNLPPYIYQLFNEVILPAYKEKNNGQILGGEARFGLTRRDVTLAHYRIIGRPLADYLLRQQILPMLEASGLIAQDTDPDDRRKMLIFPIVQGGETEIYSESHGGVKGEGSPL